MPEDQAASVRADATLKKLNTQAVNAVSRAVGEVRRSMGARAAAKALPSIFAKAGIEIAPQELAQGDLWPDDTKSPS